MSTRYVIGWRSEGGNKKCVFIPLDMDNVQASSTCFDFGDDVLSQYKKRFSRQENVSNSIHDEDSNSDNNEAEADAEADDQHAENEEMHQEDSITQDTDDADGIIDSDDIAAKYISMSVLNFMMHK